MSSGASARRRRSPGAYWSTAQRATPFEEGALRKRVAPHTTCERLVKDFPTGFPRGCPKGLTRDMRNIDVVI